MAYAPNLAVPYVGPIGQVQPGGICQIAGYIPPNAKWFAINLQCGPNTNPRDDIALHINPRFEGNLSRVVRNSLQAQQWGPEENFGHFPFTPGQQFEVLVLLESDHFKIAANGQHYTEFRHRMPLQRVNTIAIDGDVQLASVRYESPAGSSPAHTGIPSAPSPQPQHYQPGMPPHPMPHHSSSPYQAPSPQYYGAPAGYGAGHAPPPAGLAPGAYSMGPQYGVQHGAYGATLPQAPSTSGYGYGGHVPYPQHPTTSPMPVPGVYQSQYPSADYLHATSAPMPVPGTSPMAGRKSPSMLPGIAMGAGAGVLAGAAAYGASRLMYPHGGSGMHGFGKHKGMKFKHKWHKPKFHKFPKHKGFKHKWSHKWHKGWKHGGWGSHSSSSSESE